MVVAGTIKANIGLVTLVVASFFTLQAQAQKPALQLIQDPASPNYGSVRVAGVDLYSIQRIQSMQFDFDDWKAIFPVMLQAANTQSDMPAILGSYSTDESSLIFTPRFRFVPGLTYEAQFNFPLLYSMLAEKPPYPSKDILSLSFTIDDLTSHPPTRVTQIYPTSSELPMNQLKLYLHFSGNMQKGQAYDNIQLFHSTGEAVEAPFLEIPQELWNSNGNRLTVLFDPGRIKRDLAPNLQMGLPLQEGRSYRLVIDKSWKDQFGNSLQREFVKEFKVVAVDRESPNPEKWKKVLPKAGTRDPIQLHFGEALDHALLQRMIWVLTEKNEQVEGSISITNVEKTWQFTPVEPWAEAEFNIAIDSRLEDLAGNSISRLFDTDLSKDTVSEERTIYIPISLITTSSID